MMQSLHKTIQRKPLILGILSGIFVLLSIVHLTIGFSLPVFILLTIIAGVLIAKEPVIGVFASVIAMMLFERWFSLVPIEFQDYSIKIYPLDVFLVGSLLIAVATMDRRQIRVPATPFRWFLAYEAWILLVAAVSWVLGADRELIYSGVKNFAFYPLLLPLTAVVFHDPRDLQKLFRVMLVTGLATFGFFVIGLATGNGVWTEFTPLSTTGERFFSIPHTLYASMAFVLLLSGYAHHQFSRSIQRIVPFVLCVMLIPIALSLHRHLWLGLLAGLMALVMTTRFHTGLRMTRIAVLLGIAIVTVITLYGLLAPSHPGQPSFYGFTQRSVSLLTLSHYRDVSAEWRFLSWNEAGKAWLASPIVGQGFSKALSFEFEGIEQSVALRDLHNDPLLILAQFGIIGSVLWFGLIIGTVKPVLGHALNLTHEWMRTSSIAILAMMFVASLFSSYVQANSLIVPFWMILGGLWSLWLARCEGLYEDKGRA